MEEAQPEARPVVEEVVDLEASLDVEDSLTPDLSCALTYLCEMRVALSDEEGLVGGMN